MIITRFAPSPTGFLHIGGLRTALFCYCLSKKTDGKFLVRIEDTDFNRNSEAAKEAIIEVFKWTGLNYDELFFQSQRMDIYKSYVNKLLEEGKAYKCYMSKEELDLLRENQIKNGKRPRYNGKYRDNKKELNKPFAIRLKVDYSKDIEFFDEVKGKMKFNPNDILDDFIIARTDGTPTYNFVVVIDDILMKITHVVRGDDHLSNTPKQIAVYRALNKPFPKFAHIPMINNEDGKKLSKRDGAADVMEYKREGYLPEALLNFLIRLGWSYENQEIFSLDDMIRLFDLNKVNSSASNYSKDKLNWINSHYIKVSGDEKIKILLKEDFNLNLDKFSKSKELLKLYKERVNNLKELSVLLDPIVNGVKNYNGKAIKKYLKEDNIKLLNLVYDKLCLKDFISIKDIEEMITNIVSENGVGYAKVAQPIRIALLGDTNSPPISEIMLLLGTKEVIARIKKLLNTLL